MLLFLKIHYFHFDNNFFKKSRRTDYMYVQIGCWSVVASPSSFAILFLCLFQATNDIVKMRINKDTTDPAMMGTNFL